MLRRLLDGLYLFAGYAAGGFMVLIFVLMMGLSAGRPIGFNIPAGDDIVAVPADVDTGHLWGAIGVDRGQMDEPPRGHRRPGGLVESDEAVSHASPPFVAPAEVTGRCVPPDRPRD